MRGIYGLADPKIPHPYQSPPKQLRFLFPAIGQLTQFGITINLMSVEAPTTDPTLPDPAPQPGLAHSAGILALGNLASRLLGLVREIVIAALFGTLGAVSAFGWQPGADLTLRFPHRRHAERGSVPVLSDYARRSRTEFTLVVSALLSVFAVVLTVLVLLLEATAPGVAALLAGGFRTTDPALLTLTAQLIRLLAPVVWFLGLAGAAMAVLYALQRFPSAIATAVFNLGIVVAALLLAGRLGIYSLAVGVLVGSGVQLGLMIWMSGEPG